MDMNRKGTGRLTKRHLSSKAQSHSSCTVTRVVKTLPKVQSHNEAKLQDVLDVQEHRPVGGHQQHDTKLHQFGREDKLPAKGHKIKSVENQILSIRERRQIAYDHWWSVKSATVLHMHACVQTDRN